MVIEKVALIVGNRIFISLFSLSRERLSGCSRTEPADVAIVGYLIKARVGRREKKRGEERSVRRCSSRFSLSLSLSLSLSFPLFANEPSNRARFVIQQFVPPFFFFFSFLFPSRINFSPLPFFASCLSSISFSLSSSVPFTNISFLRTSLEIKLFPIRGIILSLREEYSSIISLFEFFGIRRYISSRWKRNFDDPWYRVCILRARGRNRGRKGILLS